jgi:flavodoxin
MKKMLVVYYSWSNGNTKRIAEQLTNGTGADIARIETTVMKRWLNREKER